MVNPVTTFGNYFGTRINRIEIRLQWVDKLKAFALKTQETLNNSEYFWMAASIGLLCTIDWALKHALVRLVEG